MTYLIADMCDKKRIREDDTVRAAVLAHLGIEGDEAYCPMRNTWASWNDYVTAALDQIDRADRIVDIRVHDDPWDRRHGFESNVEFDYALLIGKAIECMPFRVEDEK